MAALLLLQVKRPMNIIENISMILNGLAIEPWEIFSYTSLGSVYIFMGLYQSFLLGTFVFTYYWGYKNLLEYLAQTGGHSEAVIFLYVICGLFIVIVAIMSCFAKQLRRAFIMPPV